jgi:hypothetical protein
VSESDRATASGALLAAIVTEELAQLALIFEAEFPLARKLEQADSYAVFSTVVAMLDLSADVTIEPVSSRPALN